MLQLLGTTLRSGFSILQGLTTVSQQLSDPIGKDMRHVVAEARLGRSLVDALSEVAQRVRSDDFEWVVTAIGIQREVGGNLAELLDIVADTMIARARIRGEAQTLTAEGRIGAAVISILPIAIGFFVYAVNPSYISPLFHQAFGEILFYGLHRAGRDRHLLDPQARRHRGLTCCPWPSSPSSSPPRRSPTRCSSRPKLASAFAPRGYASVTTTRSSSASRT